MLDILGMIIRNVSYQHNSYCYIHDRKYLAANFLRI